MLIQTLNDKLHKLDFKTDSSVSGLLFTEPHRNYKDDPNVSFDEILILQQARELKARAVYFRRMGEKTIPQLFIYDNSDNILDEDLPHIHIKLWSSGIVPLYYVFDKTEVRIFNCRKPVDKTNLKATPFDDFSLVSDAHEKYKKYSASLFQNGSFWELRENKKHFSINSSSYKKLIDGLKKIRDEFIKGQNEHICNKLLVLSIFVKYLEEREDSKGNRVLSTDYFSKYDGATCFCDVLRNKKIIQFFKDLGKDVNGKIFELDEQEQKEISKLNHLKLADFLDARQDNYQYVFWKLYDFNCLPVELISRIYEEFIPKRKDIKRKDITYTPVHLVNFMVDECMPVTKPKDDISIIDVSCGSGIFLVAAFKRIVQWWQKEEYEKTDEKTDQIKKPKIGKLKSILRKQIFGVDIEPEAVKLAIFSLTVALCDMLEPKKAWDELTEEKLIDLSKNIVAQGFFDFVKTNRKFDLIIGNPPFNPPVEGKNEKEKYWQDITNKIETDYAIPDKNIALLFLQQSMKLLKKGARLSLVIPSGPLLYNETIQHRHEFLKRYNVPQIFDFSSLSGVLFEGRNYPVVVLFVQNIPPDDKDILHVAIRRTRTSKEKLYFEIDKYDLYYVPKELAKTEQLIWKANYLGGGHLSYLIKRIRHLRTLEEFLKEKKKLNSDWEFAEGYIIGENGTKKATHLTNKNMIPTNRFNSDTIADSDIQVERAKYFKSTAERNKKIFEAPHILIKERPSLPVAFRKDDLIFKHDIIGIHAPQGQESELLNLRKNIINNRVLYKMLSISGSGRAGISRSPNTILKSDIMELPYPDDFNKLRLSKAEEIICDDVIKYYAKQLAKNEEAEVNTENANGQILKAFAKVFCDSLNSIYKEESKQFYPLENIESNSFICLSFAYGNPNNPQGISETEKRQIEKGDLSCLIDNHQDSNVLYKRIIKLYQKDKVYLVKPKILRYWLKSIALRDANEVFTDLVSSGY